MTNDSKQKTPKVAKSSANKWKKAVVDENVEICKKATFDRATIDPPFCPSSTCPIMCLFGTLQQFPSGPLLLMQLILQEPPWRL